ncbi:hypothetical protein [Sorangium sp. So ce362]|uniref:hypothetical protein n=1 Tax=Sorangium sp. So ce362 TaxID=3133303 RepID=UPI003F5D5BD3
MQAPAGEKHCAACRRAEAPEDPRAVLSALASGPKREPTQPARKPGLTGRGLGCIIIVGALVVALVGVALERPNRVGGGGAHRPATQTEAQRADDAEADDAVRVLRAYYGIGQAVAAADWRWAKCHDETKGFDPLLDCAKSVGADIQALRARIPAPALATSSCGHEIEGAHRRYVEAQERFHADVVAWLEKHRAALTAPLKRAALPDGACDAAPKACEAQPIDASEKYGPGDGASYARVNGIECTKRLFTCGAADNVCFVNKVASRLGLGPEASRLGDLTVGSTGRRIR